MAEAGILVNPDSLFTDNEAELQQLVDCWKIPLKYLQCLTSYTLMKDCFAARGLSIDEIQHYIPIWLFLDIEHDERNRFLSLTQRSTIDNEDAVRTVGELREHVRSHWPNITATVSSLPFKEDASDMLDISGLLLLNLHMIQVIFNSNEWHLAEFMSLDSVMSLLAWLENNRISYYLQYPIMWRIMGMTKSQRAEILKAVRRQAVKDRRKWTAGKGGFDFNESTSTLNVAEFVTWAFHLIPMVTKLPGESEEDTDLNALDYLEKAVEGSILAYSYNDPPAHKYKTTKLCSIDLFHMTDEESRDAILGLYGLSLKDIDNLRKKDELKLLLLQYSELSTEERNVEEYQQYWDVLEQPVAMRRISEEWPRYGDLDIRTITTVGDFLEWMYRHNDFIKRKLERKVKSGENIHVRFQCRRQLVSMNAINADIERRKEELMNMQENVSLKQESDAKTTKRSKGKKSRLAKEHDLPAGDTAVTGQGGSTAAGAASKVPAPEVKKKGKGKASAKTKQKGMSKAKASEVKAEDRSEAVLSEMESKGKGEPSTSGAKRKKKKKTTVSEVQTEDKCKVSASELQTNNKGDDPVYEVQTEDNVGVSALEPEDEGRAIVPSAATKKGGKEMTLVAPQTDTGASEGISQDVETTAEAEETGLTLSQQSSIDAPAAGNAENAPIIAKEEDQLIELTIPGDGQVSASPINEQTWREYHDVSLCTVMVDIRICNLIETMMATEVYQQLVSGPNQLHTHLNNLKQHLNSSHWISDKAMDNHQQRCHHLELFIKSTGSEILHDLPTNSVKWLYSKQEQGMLNLLSKDAVSEWIDGTYKLLGISGGRVEDAPEDQKRKTLVHLLEKKYLRDAFMIGSIRNEIRALSFTMVELENFYQSTGHSGTAQLVKLQEVRNMVVHSKEKKILSEEQKSQLIETFNNFLETFVFEQYFPHDTENKRKEYKEPILTEAEYGQVIKAYSRIFQACLDKRKERSERQQALDQCSTLLTECKDAVSDMVEE